MPRKPLSLEEIKKTNILLRQVFKYITNLKNKDPLAKSINNPRLPVALTESLALYLLSRNKLLKNIKGYEFEFGGRKEADIIAKKRNKKIKIEVKATALQAFQFFSDKDIKADYIIWLHFGEFFIKAKDIPLEIYGVKKPIRYFKKSQKINLAKFKDLVGKKNLITKNININSL